MHSSRPACALIFVAALHCGCVAHGSPSPSRGPVDSSGSEPVFGESDTKLKVGGALRLNAFSKSWDDANRDKLGDLESDTFRINVDGSYSEILVSAEYRLYSGYSMLHHGYVGYAFDDESEVHIGVHRKPFGLLPYASHNWFFDLTYYLGMEDDYDAGIKYVRQVGNLDVQLAFYKNDEGSFTGDSVDSARYSYDVVKTDAIELSGSGVTTAQTNEETNQLNGRLAYTFDHGDKWSTEVGGSVEYGGLYNSTTARMGDHWATAMHLNGNYSQFNVMLEWVQYEFDPKNPAGSDDGFVIMGAYDAPYKVASRGDVVLANVAYTIPFENSNIDSVKIYANYSRLMKDIDGFPDSQQFVVGSLVAAGPLWTYFDFAFGKNHPWLGPEYGAALAEGAPAADWELRFNINVGYYF